MDFDTNGGTRNDGGSAIINALVIALLNLSKTSVNSKLNFISIGVFNIIDRMLYGSRCLIRRHVIEWWSQFFCLAEIEAYFSYALNKRITSNLVKYFLISRN